MNKIDFVVTWVDGSDEKWLKEKKKYSPDSNNDNSAARYRDFEILKYWFRGIEENAPWVNKVYFITWGHIPKWLNTNNEKLVIVNHKDYIPEKYLPTFNSCTIELNMHRIKELSENFVYFNDDMFLMNKVKESDFFINGMPRDYAVAGAIIPSGRNKFEHRVLNNMNFINKHFKIKEVIRKHPFKWFNIRYGLTQVSTLLMLPFTNFSCIKYSHLPVSYNKSNFNKIWEMDEKLLDMSCIDKFRSFYGINHWIIEDYQKVTGNFIPRSIKFGKYLMLTDNNLDEVNKAISDKRLKLLCLNDDSNLKEFDKVKENLINAFEKRFNKKSSFEK